MQDELKEAIATEIREAVSEALSHWMQESLAPIVDKHTANILRIIGKGNDKE